MYRPPGSISQWGLCILSTNNQLERHTLRAKFPPVSDPDLRFLSSQARLFPGQWKIHYLLACQAAAY